MRKLSASLLLVALMASGCSDAASTEQTTLMSWTRDAGLVAVVQGVAESVSATAAELKGLGSTAADVRKMVAALKKSGETLGAQANALAGEPASSDTEYEKQRLALVEAMQSYAKTTAALQGLDLTGITLSIKALTAISTSLTSFNTYVQEHGDDPVAAA